MINFILTRSMLGLIAIAWLESCGGGSGDTAPASGPSIVTTSLADGTIGTAYSQSVLATGGNAPLSWNVVSGNLPHGLLLPSSAGNSVTISGIPDRVQANVAFTIQVTDANGRSVKRPRRARPVRRG